MLELSSSSLSVTHGVVRQDEYAASTSEDTAEPMSVLSSSKCSGAPFTRCCFRNEPEPDFASTLFVETRPVHGTLPLAMGVGFVLSIIGEEAGGFFGKLGLVLSNAVDAVCLFEEGVGFVLSIMAEDSEPLGTAARSNASSRKSTNSLHT